MNFKLSALVAAALLASGSANAAIDNGASGNGELFFNIWDANGSYTFDLNTTITAFETSVTASGNLDLQFVMGQSFSSFLTGVGSQNLGNLQWNIVANDNSGARRLLTTYTTLPAGRAGADVVRSATLKVGDFVSNVNSVIGSSDSVAVLSSSTAYAGNTATFGATLNGLLNFSNTGGLNSTLNFMRINASSSGIAASTYTPYVDGTAVTAWVDGNTLHLAAAPVPEASTYGMMLAGLGLVGFMAGRRRRV